MSRGRTIVIIQARMTSERLPGKVLLPLGPEGKPILQHVIERCERARGVHEVVVAAPRGKEQQPIIELCNSLEVACFTGPEDDVLTRYYLTARATRAEVVVRITADCPAIDPDVIETMLARFTREQWLKYMTAGTEGGFPRGYDVEVFDFETLRSAYRQATTRPWREHVTPWMRKMIAYNQRRQSKCHPNLGAYSFTVDTPDDYAYVKRMFRDLRPGFDLNDAHQWAKKEEKKMYRQSLELVRGEIERLNKDVFPLLKRNTYEFWEFRRYMTVLCASIAHGRGKMHFQRASGGWFHGNVPDASPWVGQDHRNNCGDSRYWLSPYRLVGYWDVEIDPKKFEDVYKGQAYTLSAAIFNLNSSIRYRAETVVDTDVLAACGRLIRVGLDNQGLGSYVEKLKAMPQTAVSEPELEVQNAQSMVG